jgi:hypothetical protein
MVPNTAPAPAPARAPSFSYLTHRCNYWRAHLYTYIDTQSILAAVPVAEWGRSCWEWMVDTTFQLQVPFVSWSLARGNCSALCVMHAPTAGRRACLQLQLASIMAKVHTKWLSGRLRFYLLHTTSDSRQARGAFQSNCSPFCAVAIWAGLDHKFFHSLSVTSNLEIDVWNSKYR